MKKLLLFLLLSTSFPTFADWKLQKEVDDFEETTFYYIRSDIVEPNKPMTLTHNNAWAFLYFNCYSKNIIMKVSMTNLVNEHFYYEDTRWIRINMKVDGEIHRDIAVVKDFNNDFIHFDKRLTKRILVDAREVIIQLNHYGQGLRTYSFNMEGLRPLLVNQCRQDVKEQFVIIDSAAKDAPMRSKPDGTYTLRRIPANTKLRVIAEVTIEGATKYMPDVTWYFVEYGKAKGYISEFVTTSASL